MHPQQDPEDNQDTERLMRNILKIRWIKPELKLRDVMWHLCDMKKKGRKQVTSTVGYKRKSKRQPAEPMVGQHLRTWRDQPWARKMKWPLSLQRNQKVLRACSARFWRVFPGEILPSPAAPKKELVSADQRPPTSTTRWTKWDLENDVSFFCELPQEPRHPWGQCIAHTTVVSTTNWQPPRRGKPSTTTSKRRLSVANTGRSRSLIKQFVLTRPPASLQMRAAAEPPSVQHSRPCTRSKRVDWKVTPATMQRRRQSQLQYQFATSSKHALDHGCCQPWEKGSRAHPRTSWRNNLWPCDATDTLPNPPITGGSRCYVVLSHKKKKGSRCYVGHKKLPLNLLGGTFHHHVTL